jgi:TolA-binding protein
MKNRFIYTLAIFLFANLANAQDADDEILDVLSAQEMERQIQSRQKIERIQGVEHEAPALEYSPPSGDSVADLIARLNYMEEEMRNLNGQIANLQHELKNVSTRVDESSKLITESEKYVARPGDVNDKYVIKVDGAEVQAGEEAEVEDLAVKEEEDFNAAISKISAQNLADAKMSFSEFIANYPESEKLADSYFWLGEISMDEAQYKESALNYLKSYKADKQGKRAEEALLKSSTALGKLGKKEEACNNLTTLKNMEGLQDLIKEQATSEAIKLGCK